MATDSRITFTSSNNGTIALQPYPGSVGAFTLYLPTGSGNILTAGVLMSPPPIGNVQPNSATFTVLTVNNTLVDSSGATGASGQALFATGNGIRWQTAAGGSVSSVSGSGTVAGITLSGTVTSSGNLTLGGSLVLSSPPPIGATAPNTGAFTTLSATSLSAQSLSATNLSAQSLTATNISTSTLAVSSVLSDGSGAPGTNGQIMTSTGSGIRWTTPAGVSLSSPPPIGDATPNTGAFTRLTASTPPTGDSSGNVATTAWVLQSVSTSGFPAGTRLLFQQTSAPAGWTKETSYNNYALRITSGSVSTGGSVPFTTAFGPGGETGSTTLDVNQMPSHSHGVNDPGHNHGLNDPGHSHSIYDPGHNHGVGDPGHSHSYNDPGHDHTFQSWRQVGTCGGGGLVAYYPGSGATGVDRTDISIDGAGTGISIGASGTGVGVNGATTNIGIAGAYTGLSTQGAGGGSGHTHSLGSFAVQYVDAIICYKS